MIRILTILSYYFTLFKHTLEIIDADPSISGFIFHGMIKDDGASKDQYLHYVTQFHSLTSVLSHSPSINWTVHSKNA